MKAEQEYRWHNMSISDVYSRLESNEKGLASDEVARRLESYGYNELEDEGKTSPWLLLAEQFKNILIIILLVAVALSAFLGEVVDAIVVFIIILFAAGLGFIQEYRAERAIQALKKMAAPFASALRGGEEKDVPSRELVPGDVIMIRTGDRIPADSRIIEDVNLRVDEASLTGESVAIDKSDDPVEADATIGDRFNMVYTGTAAVYGRCKAIVVNTGTHTEFGKIANLLREVTQEKTPLQVNLDRMGKWIAIGALALCFVLAIMGVLRGHPPLEMLIWGVSLAVAAVPEALPAVVTISLALGVNRMVKRHALMRKLPAVETLGCTTIICSDKTGTLTQDEMTLRRVWLSGKIFDISGSGYEPQGSFSVGNDAINCLEEEHLQKYLRAARMCTDTVLYNEEGQWKIKGDPTEGALIVAGAKAGLPINAGHSFPRVDEIPFTSESKRMITVYRETDGNIAYSNGAAEVILASCKYIYKDGADRKLDEAEKQVITGVIHDMAAAALRVLGTCYKKLPEKYSLDESVADGMVFLGLGGMIDPPRPEVKDAIKTCDRAGIKAVMITGDHKLTAVAIARELGILKGGKALTGVELNNISQKELENIAEDVEVYARVSPEHKLRVVEALATRQHVVAMTGDGINDAPALKKADIGIAMGIKGTDVTKEAADMVLTDDNFTSIVAAIEEGRGIFANIKKYLVYLLSCNIGEILIMVAAVLLGPLIGIPSGILPLIAVQILYVNLATDGLPALALSVDPPSKGIMDEKPRQRNQSIFTRPVLSYLAIAGIWTGIIPLLTFIWALTDGKSVTEAQSICFVTLILIQFFNAYNCRSMNKSLFNLGAPPNKWLIMAIIWELTLLLCIVYVPFLHDPFNTYPLDLFDWTIAVVGAATIMIVVEIYKAIYRRNNR